MILLDTHALLWFIMDDARLSYTAKKFIVESDDVFVSTATLWEIAIKLSIGKLSMSGDFDALFPSQLHANQLTLLPIEVNHLAQVARLPFHHRDPFDRLIIAQSLEEDLPVVGYDTAFDAYPIKRLW